MSRRPKNHRDLKKQRGIALLISLMVITVLTVLILDLHQSVRIHFYIAGNLTEGVKAAYLVRSGVQVAAGALLADAQDNSQDHYHEDWYDFLGKLGLPMMPIGEGNVTMEINDEGSRFNLNSLVGKSGQPRTASIEIFKKLLIQEELDENLVNPIVDWIDSDEETFDGAGLEDEVYGYSAELSQLTSKNAPFSSLQELRLVSGMTDEVWAKLEPLVTVYGDARMNLNTVDKKIIKAVLSSMDENADTSIADRIVEWREQTGGEEEEDSKDGENSFLSGLTGGEGNYFSRKNMIKTLVNELEMDRRQAQRFARHFTVFSRYYRINCTAIVENVQKNAFGIVQRNKKKASIIYFRVAPGVGTEFQEMMEEQNQQDTGAAAPTPDVQGIMQSLGLSGGAL